MAALFRYVEQNPLLVVLFDTTLPLSRLALKYFEIRMEACVHWLRMKKFNRYFFLLFFLTVSCSRQDPLLSTWKITRVAYTPSGLATPESIELGRQIQARSATLENSTFALYAEGKSAFFSTKTPYRQGTWSKNGKVLLLQLSAEGTPYEFEIVENTEELLLLQLLDHSTVDGEIILTCRKSEAYQYSGADLLAPSENTWRIPSARSESETEIKERAKQHLDYLIKYFECVGENGQNYFETGILCTPFVFHAHGIGLSRETIFAKRWEEGYYNPTQANAGYQQLKMAMRSVKTYPQADSYTAEYLVAFKKMREYFDH